MANFDITIDNNVATIWMDQKGSEVNTLSVKMLDHFSQLLDQIEEDSDIKAAVLISQKSDCFIAGADIKDFMTIEDSKENTKEDPIKENVKEVENTGASWKVNVDGNGSGRA